MKQLFWCFALLLPIVLLAQRPQNIQPIKITGTVVDKDTGQPLEYATLILQRVRNPDQVTGGITDAYGKFEVETLPGMFNISVEYISYLT